MGGQALHLGSLGGPPVDAGALDPRRHAESRALLLDLHRQLPRRRQRQHDGPVSRFEVGLCVDVDDRREEVRQGLP